MKFLIVFVALFAVALAGVGPASEVLIKSLINDVEPESFKYEFTISDGQTANAEGHLENAGTDHEALNVKGAFSFVADDGKTYTVNYIADENGFQPQGDHLPVA